MIGASLVIICISESMLATSQVRLVQSMYLDVGTWMNLVNSVARSTACFVIQVIAHHKDAVITQTSQPHVTFSTHVQHDSLPNIQPVQHMQSICHRILACFLV